MKLDHFPQNIKYLLVMEFILKCFYKTEDIFPSIILVGKCVLNIFLKLPSSWIFSELFRPQGYGNENLIF